MPKKSINKSSANGSVQKSIRNTVRNSARTAVRTPVRTARQNSVSKFKSVAATSAPRRPSLTSLSTKALAAELRRRRSQLPKLMKKAAKLQAALAKVMASIASLGGATGGLDVRSAAASVSARANSLANSQAISRANSQAISRANSQAISRVGARAKSSSSSAPRLRNGQPTIGEHLVEILRARAEAMSPNELGPILGKRLSRKITDNFRVQINLTLARLMKQGRVSKLGRAQYVARGVTIANID